MATLVTWLGRRRYSLYGQRLITLSGQTYLNAGYPSAGRLTQPAKLSGALRLQWIFKGLFDRRLINPIED